MKKDCWKLIIVVLFVISFISLIFGFIPMVVALITTAHILKIDTTNQWISFGKLFGSYYWFSGNYSRSDIDFGISKTKR